MPIIEAHKGKVAVAVKHLGTGESFAYHETEVMPTASLIKFPVMIEAYRQAAAKKVDLNATVVLKEQDKVPGSGILTSHFTAGARFTLRDAVRLMIAFSDNTATNLVLDAIGIGSTAATMETLGYPNTKIHSKVFRRDTSVFPERSKQFGLGSTTRREMVRLCEALHRKEVVSPKACDEMLDHLRACEDRDKFPRLLPPGAKIAFKTGSLAETRTAAGIIEWPGGPGRALRPVVRERRQAMGSRITPATASAPRSPGRSTTISNELLRRRSRQKTDRRTRSPVTAKPDHLRISGKACGLSLAVDARQRRMALGQQHAVAQDLVLVHDLDVSHLRDRRAHGQDVVVLRRPLELATDVDDHQEVTAVLDLAIRDAPLAEHLGPSHLEINEVIRMVQEPHAIRLGITHADRHLVAVTHDRLRDASRIISVAT